MYNDIKIKINFKQIKLKASENNIFFNTDNPYCQITIAIFIVSIAIFRVISTYSVFNQTVDEHVHIACGMEWLDRGTYLYGLEHPPLSRIAVAMGPYVSGIRLSETQNELLNKIELKEIKWNSRYRWDAGNEILYSNNRYFYNLSLARLGNIPFFLILIFVTWIWSYKLFGAASALITLFFITTMPSILGHAGLATTDIAGAGLCLFGIYAFTLWLKVPNYRYCLIFGLTWGLASLAKFSALLFLPVSAIAIIFWRILLEKRNNNKQNSQPITDGIKPILSTLPIAAIVAFVVICSGYRFSSNPIAAIDNRPYEKVDTVLGEKGKLKDIAYFILESPILPSGEFFRGILELKSHNDHGHKSYLLGKYSKLGWWYFFPVVFFIKTPLSFLFFVLIGSILLIRMSIQTRNWQIFIPFISALAIFLSVIPSNIDLGIRHILLVYPLLAIVAGYGAASLLSFRENRMSRIIPFVILLTWYLISTSFSHPDYMAYFNEIAVSSPERFRVDSDLDWGQDLNRLSIEARSRKIKNLSLAYFGSADPNKFNLPTFKVLNRHQQTAGWVAISVFTLKDVTGPTPHDGYAWLEKYKPVATIGKSIKLYYIATGS